MFFNNYNKPGPGVNKRDPNEPRIRTFFDIFPRKIWNLFKLNMLYLLVSIPFFVVVMLLMGIVSVPVIESISSALTETEIVLYDFIIRFAMSFLFLIFVGMGPVTAGFTYVIREYANDRPCWMVSDFFEKLKSNFKQGILLWIVDLALFYVFAVAIRFYSQNGIVFLQYFILVVSLVYVMMHTYIYQMMITFDLSLKNILRNSFLLTMVKAPANLLIFACYILLYIALPIFIIMVNGGALTTMIVLIAEVLFFPALTGFITNFYIIPVLDKYVNNDNK